MSSLQEIRTLARGYIKIDPNSKIFSDTTLDSFINRAYFQVQKEWQHRWRECSAYTTQSTVAWTAEYNLPTDFLKLSLVSLEWSPLQEVSKQQIRLTNYTASQGKPNQYYLYGTKIGFNSIPNSTYSIIIDYFKRLATLTSTQASELPTDFDDAIALYASYLAFKSVNKMDSATGSLADYNQVISTLLTSYIYDDMNTSFSYQRWGGNRLSDTSSARLN